MTTMLPLQSLQNLVTLHLGNVYHPTKNAAGALGYYPIRI